MSTSLALIVAQMLGVMTATWLFHWLVPRISGDVGGRMPAKVSLATRAIAT
jgi:glycerol uptake facilitator-like aquaporin